MSTTAQPAGVAGQAAINAQVAAAKTSFYWAMRFLPKARREAMFKQFAEDRTHAKEDSEKRIAALKDQQAENLRKFKESLAQGQRPDDTLWPQPSM